MFDPNSHVTTMTMWAELNVTSHNNKISATNKIAIMQYIIWLQTDVKKNQEFDLNQHLKRQNYDIISASLEVGHRNTERVIQGRADEDPFFPRLK